MCFLAFPTPQDEARRDVLWYTAGTLAEVEEILGDINITKWIKVFDEWKHRLKRYIDAEGEYLWNN
jgi:hypothetical protein